MLTSSTYSPLRLTLAFPLRWRRLVCDLLDDFVDGVLCAVWRCQSKPERGAWESHGAFTCRGF